MTGSNASEANENQRRDEALASIEVLNLYHIGPEPIGRWTGIGVARKAAMDALGLTAEEAAAAIGLHLGKTIPFKFASWKVVASIRIDGAREEPMMSLGGSDGAPSFNDGVFHGLFFYGDEADQLQWASGTFGGSISKEWGFLHSGQWLTLHNFTVHGTVIDELAFYRAFGIPCDEAALAILQKDKLVEIRHVEATSKKGGGRTRSQDWESWIAYAALCVYEGILHGSLNESQALKVVADRMAEDGLEGLARSTVQRAMSRILDTLRQHQ